MKLIVLFALLVPCVLGEACTSKNCNTDKGCVCASNVSPISIDATPQFVLLTFDDAINLADLELLYKPILNRKNADGSQVSATFFVPHEYSDYEVVNMLYNQGHEIASHSITKQGSEYWRKASKKVLTDEFCGQKEIVSHFANIPASHIRGARIPYLEMRGNDYIEALKTCGIEYDSTWVFLSSNNKFPFTLDFESGQPCLVGECPNKTYPGSWISPINNNKGNGTIECNSLLGCQMGGTAKEISTWLIGEFEKSTIKRTPFKLLLNSVWFRAVENSLEGFKLFLDHIGKMKNVFVVSERQAIEWRKKPIALDKYKPTKENQKADCSPVTCQLQNEEGNIRYMRSCVDCPDVYPWLGNPRGEAE